MPSGGQIVTLFVVILLAGILLPVSFNQVFDANTTNWDSSTAAIWVIIPLIAVAAVIIGLIGFFRTD